MLHLTLILGACFAQYALAQTSFTLSAAATAPTDASPTVDPTFPGFAFEERSFYYYAGPGGQPNKFSQNLINAITTRTNAKPVIRVGGSSLNAAKYDPTQSEALNIKSNIVGHSIPIPMTMGPSYFQAFKNLNASYILDIPMNANTDISMATSFAKDAWSTIGVDNIAILELGNEVNSYGKSYTPQDYATQFASFSSGISTALGISTSDKRWQAGSLANDVGPAWNTSAMFTSGLSSYTSRLNSFSVHYYQVILLGGTLNVQTNLMNHGNIVEKLAQFQSEIDQMASLNLTFNIEEAACGPGTIGNQVNERSFGAALWQVDFMLTSMVMGVGRVNMQSGLGFDFSLWAGTNFSSASNGERPAAVYANYYAQLFVADFIAMSGKMQAANIDLNTDDAAAYAAYESGSLKRLAIVNFDYWNGPDTSSGNRANTTFSVTVPGGITQATVQRLSSHLGAGALDSNDISWAGQSWSTQNDGTPYSASSTGTSLVKVSNGILSVAVPASEAVMVLFNQASSSSSSSSSASGTTMRASTATMSSTRSATGSAATSASGSAATSTSLSTAGAVPVAVATGLGYTLSGAAALVAAVLAA